MKRLAYFSMASALAASSLYGYAFFTTQSNRMKYQQFFKQHEKPKNIQIIKMPGNDGKDKIEKSLENGNIIFIKYDYRQALSVSHFLYGFFTSFLSEGSQFDSLGYLYNKQNTPYVIYNQFGQTKVKPLLQLVTMPYIAVLIAQHNDRKIKNIDTKFDKLLNINQQATVPKLIKENYIDMANRVNQYLYEQNTQYIVDIIQYLQNKSRMLIPTINQYWPEKAKNEQK